MIKIPDSVANLLIKKKEEIANERYLISIDYDDTFTVNPTAWR
jgi:hypothetical protein